jgi:hypothetical protein
MLPDDAPLASEAVQLVIASMTKPMSSERLGFSRYAPSASMTRSFRITADSSAPAGLKGQARVATDWDWL